MNKAKYIKTNDGKIIIFSGGISHEIFSDLHPVSAGFIDIYSQNGKTVFSCYGKSESLKLEANGEEDSLLAELQIGDDY